MFLAKRLELSRIGGGGAVLLKTGFESHGRHPWTVSVYRLKRFLVLPSFFFFSQYLNLHSIGIVSLLWPEKGEQLKIGTLFRIVRF